ncbi:MAG: hypothetical protein ABIA21_01305 [Candidatus Aenigmatarchaeota archaeon]
MKKELDMKKRRIRDLPTPDNYETRPNETPPAYMSMTKLERERSYPWLYKKRISNGYWDNKNNRINATKWLLDHTGKKPSDLIQKDFTKNRLSTILTIHYEGSPYKAIIEAGYELYPWQMTSSPNHTWEDILYRVCATILLVEDILEKNPKEITYDEFSEHLRGLLKYTDNSAYNALREAGYRFHIPRPKLNNQTHNRSFWENRENRIESIKKAVKKIGKNPRDITSRDLEKYCRSTLRYYNDSTCDALRDAGYMVRRRKKNYWTIRDNRIRKTQVVVRKLEKKGKTPGDITYHELLKYNGMRMVLKHNEDSPKSVLREAGYDI